MSYTFAKLSQSILDSSIWDQPAETRLVWITLLAMADHHGRVHASIGGIARRAIVPRQAAEEAMDCFLSPDPDSRTPDNDGRRVERIEGGFRILNYLKYREMRDPQSRKEQNREAKRRQRERQPRSADVSQMSATVSQSQPESAHREADVEAEVEVEPKEKVGGGAVGVRSSGADQAAAADCFAEIPSEDEVVEFGSQPQVGVPESYCRNYHARTEEKRMWLNARGQLIDWRRQLKRWWENDRATWKDPGPKTKKPKYSSEVWI